MRFHTERLSPGLLVPLIAASAIAASASADQQLSIWCGCGGKNPGIWSNAANWDPLGVPNNNGNTTFNVLVSSGFGTPVVDMNTTVDKITIIPGNGLFIENGRILTIIGEDPSGPGNAGVLANEGTISSNSVGSVCDLVIFGEALLLTNASGEPGLWQMSASTNNRVRGAFGNETFFIDSMQRIEGAGNIGLNGLDIDNHGTLSGTHDGVPLIIDPRDAEPVFNFGILQAESNGIIRFNSGIYENVSPNDGGPVGAMQAITGGAIELNGSVTVRHSAMFGQGGGVIRPMGNTVTFWDVQFFGPVEIPNNIDPRFQDAILNSQQINLNSTGNATFMYIDNVDTAGVQLTGGGVINMSNNFENYILPWGGGEELHNVDNTIRGSGRLGNNGLSIVNDGVILADQPVRLQVDPSAGGMVNNNLMRALAGGTMRLQPAIYDNTNGFIEAWGDSLIELNGPEIHGGTLLSNSAGPTGPGRFEIIGNTTTLRDLTLDAIIDVPNDVDPRLQDDIANLGEINLGSTGNATFMYIDNVSTGGVTLTGGGEINLSNDFNNYILAWNGNETLHNVDNLIRGSGRVGNNSLAFINGGTFLADQPTRLEFDPSAGGLVNTGLLRADDGGTLRLGTGIYDNTAGTIDCINGSTIEFFGGDVDSGGGTIQTLDGATVNLNGSFAIRNTVFEGDDASFTLTGATGVLEDVTFVATMDWMNNADTRVIDSLVNSGEINLLSTGNATFFYVDNIDTNGAQISGGGTITMSDNFENYFLAWNGGETLENVDNTIRGAGRYGNNSLTLINSGEIIGDQPNRLQVDPSTSMTNTGLLQAADGGTLRLMAGVFFNDGGLIEALPGSTVELNACEIDGGVVRGVAAGPAEGVVNIIGNTVTLRDLTLDGTVNVQNNIDPRLQDGIVNEGVINLGSTGNATFLYIDNVDTDGVQLSGGGTINTTDDFNNYILAWNGNETLVNVDNTIRGSGRFGNNSLAIVNQGTIIADQPTALELNPNSPNNFTNEGTILVEAGGLLRSIDNINQTDGETFIEGTLEMTADTFILAGGTLSGIGIVNGSVNNTGGTFKPGIEIGEFLVDGTFDQGAGGTLNVELAGTVPVSEHDVVTVTGTATLAGTLDIDFADGFEPEIDSSYVVLTAEDVVGKFESVTGPGSFDVIYGDQTVTLVVTAGGVECPEDLNGSGTVDGADLGLLLGNWGGSGVGDLNDDGSVDGADLGLLLGAWGPCE